MAISVPVLRESLADLADAPSEVREAAGRELLYALRLIPRPADPEPDEDDGPWCLPAHLAPSRRQRLSYAALQAPFRPALWAVCAALIATATTTHLTRGNRNA
ncbi:hypothetical protein ABZ312_11675 [Streptomyces sp. NPDC006207]